MDACLLLSHASADDNDTGLSSIAVFPVMPKRKRFYTTLAEFAHVLSVVKYDIKTQFVRGDHL